MTKIAINYIAGGFELPLDIAEQIIASDESYANILHITHLNRVLGYVASYDLNVRMHPITIAYFEEHDPDMLIEIPDHLTPNDLQLIDCDGVEYLAEKGHIWR